MRRLNNKLYQRVQDLTELLGPLQQELDEAVQEADEWADDRSEKWQESEASGAHQTWRDAIREAAGTMGDLESALQAITQEPEE